MRVVAVLMLAVCVWGIPSAVPAGNGAEPGVPILLYHRFGPMVADSMTVRTAVFEAHLKYLQAEGFEVIPLQELLSMLSGAGVPADRRCVVLVADDAHRSVFTEAFPLLKKYAVPMTLFVYPSAVSNASYAMTWAQLQEVQASGLCDIQSHTYWHPNFKKERAKLPAAEFEKLVKMQLVKSKTTLERKLGRPVDLLAWPFGIFDAGLMERAAAAGYRAAFSIERRPATRRDHPMALPRYLLADSDRGKVFEALVNTPLQMARRENRHVERRF